MHISIVKKDKSGSFPVGTITVLYSLLLFGIGVYTSSAEIVVIATLILWLNNIILSLFTYRKSIVFVIFQITFGIFLLGRFFYYILFWSRHSEIYGEIRNEFS